MARVNVEESVFGERRLQRFQTLMGWDKRKALGCLVLLWHESQGKLRIDGTAEEIAEWCWPESPDEHDMLVMALATTGFITPQDDGKFLIRGNQDQIEARVQKLTASQKGGEATKKRWEELKAKRPKSGDRDSRSASRVASHHQAVTRPNTVQGNTGQGSTGQEYSPDGECGKPAAGSPRAPYQEFVQTWNDNRGTLPGVRDLPESLKAKIRARWSEKPDLAYWTDCAKRMAASTFCCEGSWATFHWLVKNDGNHVKVAAGNYDNRDGSGPSGEIDWSKVFGSEGGS